MKNKAISIKMKQLWNKGFDIDQKIKDFTIGEDRYWDKYIAIYDIVATNAHAQMLGSIGILTTQECKSIENKLEELKKEALSPDFIIEEEYEDIHSKIESFLVQDLGEIGKKIHTGRSRNDQVLVAIQLLLKDKLLEISEKVESLFNILLNLSNKYKDVMMPGYTHTQVAMNSSFGLWFGAFAETLIDDLIQVKGSLDILNQNPLGSAAGYGSSIGIDRDFTTKKLQFATLKYNVIASQTSRGKIERNITNTLASIAATIARLSDDICLFNCQNFDFIKLPDEFTTGSSIMPHKKNPDVFELIRGQCNLIQQAPQQISSIVSNMTTGYHRDYQLLKKIVLQSVFTLKDCLDMNIHSLPNIVVNENILEDNKYLFLNTVDDVNKLVLDGMSFREAYKKVGKEITENRYQKSKRETQQHIGSIDNLCNKEIQAKFDDIYQQIKKIKRLI